MTAIIILAAGASTRMGSPKQLLHFNNRNLLQHTIDVALKTDFSPVIVVLGANAATILPVIKNEHIIITENKDWQEGLASSVRAGIHILMQKEPSIESALIMLCDQPFVTAALLKKLVETKMVTHKKIIASAYHQDPADKNTVGVPVLFDKSFFPELLQLQGQDGAKKLLIQHPVEVATVSFPEGVIDIDTPEDYKQLFVTKAQ